MDKLLVKIFHKQRRYFVGDGLNLPRSEEKRLILTFNLALICIAVSIVYTALDFVSGIFYSMPAYLILFMMPIVSLFLMRRRRFKAAKITLMISANMVVFWTAINDPFETGSFLFFIPTGIGSFAMLGFTENKTGILLSILTAVLFVIAYAGDFHFVDTPQPTEIYLKTSLIFNYFISLTIAVLISYFQMSLNRASEDDLIKKEIFAVQKNAELQKVNEELDRFVYSVSHDLRSPLSSILGLLNIARLTKEPTEIYDILKMIEERVNSQDHFIREIIDYSRNARTETLIEQIALYELVEEIIQSLRYHGNADRIAFQNLVPKNFVMHSDRIRLRVILGNLVGNAIKYHDLYKDEPFIRIRVDPATETICVEDNGSGMKPEHQEKIFQMFYRGSDKSTGSGLGLFITREAVNKLGGKIEVQSEFGKGSTFMLNIPFGQSEFL